MSQSKNWARKEQIPGFWAACKIFNYGQFLVHWGRSLDEMDLAGWV